MNCALIPSIHEMRKAFLNKINGKSMKLDELPKQLFFSSSEELIDFARQNGLHLEIKKSKSSKIEMIHWV